MAAPTSYYTRLVTEQRTQVAWTRERVVLRPPAAAMAGQALLTPGDATAPLGKQSASQMATAAHGTRPRG